MADEDEKRKNALNKLIDWMIETGQQDVNEYIEKLKSLNPSISTDDLARKIVRRKSLKNGLVGAATGLGGLITLPVLIPADLVLSWRIQIFIALSIAHVYGHNINTVDIKTDIYLILAGDSVKEALKKFGVEVSKGITKKTLEKYVTREVMKNIWKVIPQKVITKAGAKSSTSFLKMVPLVGAPIGFVFDWAATRAVGNMAIKYYGGGG